MYKKGVFLAFSASIISGFSIYINKFALSAFPEVLLFTTLKNLTVGLLILIVLGVSSFKHIKGLSKNEAVKMLILGTVGGSIPFLLFFTGLKIGSAASASFIHKTLFIWVSILAVIFLKEKFSLWQIISTITLFIGIVFLQNPRVLSFNKGEFMVFIATLFWSIEVILVKKFLPKLNYKYALLGRMFFGGLIMSLFLIFSNKFLLALNWEQIRWLCLTSILLLGYVFTWYRSLNYIPSSIGTCILTFGFVITSLLTSGFSLEKLVTSQAIGQIAIIFGVILLVYGQGFRKIFT